MSSNAPQTTQALMPELATLVQRVPNAAPTTKVDYETYLTLALIRAHTKTDDVPNVTDEQLRLYRRAAFEAAEQYTGFLLSEIRTVIESAETKSGRRYRPFFTHRLKWPSADGIVYFYGSHNGQQDRTLQVDVGARSVKIPIMSQALDVNDCCRPACGAGDLNYGMQIMYRAGFTCADEIPAGIIAGALKFIAWMVSNPGDEIMTVRNRLGKGEAGIIGTNNVALASGALEMWRQYDAEAI